jgi:hypothetical protein
LALGTEVRFRLLRQDDVPATNPLADEYVFGLQDTKQQIVAGMRQADGRLAFDFSLTAKPGPDPDRPRFSGRFASGPADDRFVYLSWRSMERGDYINRVKARLSAIGWDLIETAEKAGRPLVADMTGWLPGDRRGQVAWAVAE